MLFCKNMSAIICPLPNQISESNTGRGDGRWGGGVCHLTAFRRLGCAFLHAHDNTDTTTHPLPIFSFFYVFFVNLKSALVKLALGIFNYQYRMNMRVWLVVTCTT